MFDLLVIVSLVLIFPIHIFLVRVCGLFKKAFFRQKGLIVSYLAGFTLLGLFFYFWVFTLKIKYWQDIFWSGLYLFLIYSLFSYIYFHFFNMSETARRVRILAEIRRTGLFEKEELTQKYSSSDMVSNRLKRLIALGELRLSGDRYLIGRGVFIFPAKIVFYFRDMFYPEQEKIR